MYHRIVARNVRKIFAEISAGNWQAMVDGMAPDFSYTFFGANALSGTRRTRESLALWWQRIFRLLPGASFEVGEVIVDGAPWSTRAATIVTVSAPRPDGTVYSNVFMQLIAIRWGKVTSVRTLEDTAVLDRELARSAADGVAEATAPPITD